MASRNRRRARRARINIDRATRSGSPGAPVTSETGNREPDHPAWLVAQDLPWEQAS